MARAEVTGRRTRIVPHEPTVVRSPPEPGEPRLLSKAEVLERIGRTFPTIWAWMRQGRFPRARDLGGRPAWVEAEVNAWINALPVRKFKGDADAA